jgi:hypothetical protein
VVVLDGSYMPMKAIAVDSNSSTLQGSIRRCLLLLHMTTVVCFLWWLDVCYAIIQELFLSWTISLSSCDSPLTMRKAPGDTHPTQAFDASQWPAPGEDYLFDMLIELKRRRRLAIR